MKSDKHWIYAGVKTGGAVMAAVALLGGCSHPANRRTPASDSPDLKKYSVSFTLIRFLDVDRLVRVYHGTANSKIVRLEISNPNGEVACQNGAPSNPEAAPSQTTPYVLDTHSDQDVYCYLGPNAPPVKSFQVDYRYLADAAPPEAPAATSDLMQRALHDVQNDQLTPETLGVLEAHNLVGVFTVFARADGEPYKSAQKGTLVEPRFSRSLAAGDLLLINSVTGALGTSRSELEAHPGDASGLPAVPAHAKRSAPAATPPVAPITVHDASYLFPDERPHRLICTTQNGAAEPKIVYRGGEDLLATREVQGDFRCQLNLKTHGSEHLHGYFTISAKVIKHDEALATLQTLVHSEEQSKAARDQFAEDATLALIREDVAGLLASDTTLVQRYNHLVVAQAQQPVQPEPKAMGSHGGDELFPQWLNLNYRPGPHTFTIVPVKRGLPSAHGNVDYADYAIQDGVTPYYPENPNNPGVTSHENRFAPVTAFSSAETWGSVNTEPWEVVICPNKLADATAAVNRMAADELRGVLSTRKIVWDTLSRFGARNPSDCNLNWVDSSIRGSHSAFEPLYFQRQSLYRFTYVKEALVTTEGHASKVMAAYNPDKIEALYASPSGAAITRVIGRADNDALGPGRGHPFFSKGRLTDTPFSQATHLPPQVQLDARTLYPPVGPDGVIDSSGAVDIRPPSVSSQ